MKHIRYLSDNKTVCEKPARMGYDFVVVDTQDEGANCRVCSDLLFAHNLAEYKREARSQIVFNPPQHLEERELTTIQAALLGCLISSVMWAVIFVLFRSVFN